MAEVLFGHHPYHVVAPTQESIAASTATDLHRVFARRFRPDQAALVTVGDFENDRMLEAIKANFDSWKLPSQPPLEPPSPPAASPDHAVFLVPRPGSVQTTLELGTFAPRRGDADYEAAEVANAIYGSTFSSRLVTNIREDKGYTYSPFADLSDFRMSGLLITRADVRNEVTAPSLNEIQYELNRLATTTPSEEELSKAKHYLVGTEAILFQEQAAVAHHLATTWIDGLPTNEIAQHMDKVSQTSLAEVDQAARKYFPAYRTSIVAVGEEKVIRDAVAPFGIPVKALPQ
jgi:predicted Zn-dependent peptidase